MEVNFLFSLNLGIAIPIAGAASPGRVTWLGWLWPWVPFACTKTLINVFFLDIFSKSQVFKATAFSLKNLPV